MNAILVFFHCAANTGYAISHLERVFYRMAVQLVGGAERVHFAYPDLSAGVSQSLPDELQNVIEFDPRTSDTEQLAKLANYLQTNDIDFALGFDQPIYRPCFRTMRKSGVRAIVSYWGAPMSSPTGGVKLLLKRLQVKLTPHSPDHFVFESKAMARSATHGRGVPPSQVSVVYLGVDPEEYTPNLRSDDYLREHFEIPSGASVGVFTGHFEKRKGVHVLVRAAAELVNERSRKDFHLLLVGNRSGEARPLRSMVRGTPAEQHVTFGGYRSDVERILPCCSFGIIGSTGWDSFTVSALEMAASGLPLVVSRLQGLTETVEERVTGLTFPPGDHAALADKIAFLLDHPEKLEEMSRASRERILNQFTLDRQVHELAEVCQSVYDSHIHTISEGLSLDWRN